MTRIIRYGDFGADVSDVQQRLVECGYSIAPLELSIFTVGDTTRAAVQAFQRAEKLNPDGEVGDFTRHALEHPKSNSGTWTAAGWRLDRAQVPGNLIQVIDAAVADLGLAEDPDGSNDGPKLAKFKTRGAAWCAVAVYTWYLQRPGGANGAPWPRTASTWELYQWAQKNHRVLPFDEPWLPGDIWYVKRPPPPGEATPRGHVTLIVTALEGNRAACIGGNEGNHVRGSIRKREDATDIIRPTGLI